MTYEDGHTGLLPSTLPLGIILKKKKPSKCYSLWNKRKCFDKNYNLRHPYIGLFYIHNHLLHRKEKLRFDRQIWSENILKKI